MLRLKRMPGTDLTITVQPSAVAQEIVIKFDSGHYVRIGADKDLVHIVRDDANPIKEKQDAVSSATNKRPDRVAPAGVHANGGTGG